MKKHIAAVILAAGEGTRMKSQYPKVLHSLLGVPMVRWVVQSVSAVKPDNIVLVVGHKAEAVRSEFIKERFIRFVVQKCQKGSADAFRSASPTLKNFSGDILVVCGDVPMIEPATLKGLVREHNKHGNDLTVLTTIVPEPTGYGRIQRDSLGSVVGIVEEKDASIDERKIKEINSGIYCFKSPKIWSVISKIKSNNKKGEFYLTDAVSLINREGGKVGSVCNTDNKKMSGINSRVELSNAMKILRKSILEKHMLNGVTIIDPSVTYIDPGVKIGLDTVIYPGTILEGNTIIGKSCVLGPNTNIKNSQVGKEVSITYSVVKEAKLADRVVIGPFAHLRPGSDIRSDAKVGNFSEVKKSLIKEGAKVNHLSYIGDSVVGKKVNIGAGTITCNYDGIKKSKTIIGDRVFVGSNVNLVAPVKIGADTILAAGSTITENVPKNKLAIARSRQIHKQKKKRK